MNKPDNRDFTKPTPPENVENALSPKAVTAMFWGMQRLAAIPSGSCLRHANTGGVASLNLRLL